MWSILNFGNTMENCFLVLFILSSLTLPALSTDEEQDQPLTLEPYSLHEELSDNEQPDILDIPEQTTYKKTITELVNEQTDAIRKIISAHKSPEPDYPIVTKQEADVKHKIPPLGAPLMEQETIETLKGKCEQLAKLQKLRPDSDSDDSETEKPSNINPSLVTELTTSSQVTPTVTSSYVTPKPLIYNHRGQAYQQQKKGFYIVSNQQTDKLTPSASNHQQYYSLTAPTPTTPPVPPTLSAQASSINQNYIKMEPVVLQRTMLTNGNMLFYWYRPLRNMHQNPELAGYNYQNQLENMVGQGNNRYGSYPFYPSIRRKEELPTTTTTTTTERSPQIEIDYGSQDPDNNIYRSQYRFVVPMAYKPLQNIEASPEQFDQYAYLPEHLRPTLMNVQMPYMPTYHVIKAIKVPKQEEMLASYRDEGLYGHMEDSSSERE